MNTRLGDVMVRTGKVSPDQLATALAEQKQAGGGFLGSFLVKTGALTEQQVAEILSEQFGCQVIELPNIEIDASVLQLIPQTLATKHALIPVEQHDSTLTVAMVDPSNLVAMNDIKFVTGLDIRVVVTTETALKASQERYYEGAVQYDQIIGDLDDAEIAVVEKEEQVALVDLEKQTEDAPVVKLVNAILTDAIKKGASDIHLEPYEKSFRVRFRIDGVLYEIMKPPMKLKAAITSRIKIMANLDIAERRLPQDGRIKLKLGGLKEMDFRVNVLPTLFGEKVVMRLLDKSNLQLDMTKLGFEEQQLKEFKDAIHKPHGMVLVTGPTGSGKTTTLYSALAELNTIGTNISTAEDPVEFNLAGINQAQMHEDIGYNFAAALRAFLRQDPDIIMVGEIRDLETAEIAVKASLTGHLVLSTLHTNDAPSTINRLLNMGVEPFLVASSVNCIVAQRLARKICTECAAEVHVDPEIIKNIGLSDEQLRGLTLRQGKGCLRCSGTGYKGRIALYEVLTMNDPLREKILRGASATEIKREAIAQGMMTLRASALMRLRQGVTTVEEVLRCTTADER
jgi:type IV pilus assembly protein PilB